MKTGKSQRGQALIEFAFIIMVMALLALGVVDFALAIQQGMLVQEAATAGALTGSFDTYNATQPDLWQAAATTAGIGAKGLSITTTSYCTCSLGGASIFCTNSCSGDRPQLYIQVTATSSFASMFPYSILPHVFNLSSTVVMEVQ
jgi:Flp pilus assembly protein TadG